jgi:hypothetical protein
LFWFKGNAEIRARGWPHLLTPCCQQPKTRSVPKTLRGRSSFTIRVRIIFGDLPMRARIYQPARTAMQSGTAKTHQWVLEFAPAEAREVDPLMGWTSSADTQSQVQLRFETRAAAEDYARDKGLDYVVTEPHARKANIRPRGYGENFATDRKGAWTH